MKYGGEKRRIIGHRFDVSEGGLYLCFIVPIRRPSGEQSMNRIVAVIAVSLAAVSSRAAITYDFRSVSSGVRETTLAGTATSDRGQMRIDISRGDGAVLHD